MADIYALQGKGNTGKTGTIKLLKDLLVQKYSLSSMDILDFFHRTRGDIKIILFRVKVSNGSNKKNNKLYTIGIESYGDKVKRLRQSITDFEIVGCDIMFCACRTKGSTFNYLVNLNNRHNVNFIQQTVVSHSQQRQRNRNMANHLIQTAGL